MPSVVNLNLNIRKLSTEGRLKDAVRIVLARQNPAVDSSAYVHLLQVCIARKALSEGKQIHSHINKRGFTLATDTFLQNTLFNMYEKCGSLVDARNVFYHNIEPDVFSWNVIITAYRNNGFPQEAFTTFCQMQRTDVQPDHFTFSAILPVCASLASLKHGLQIHGRIIRCGFLSNVIVMNTLMDMYAKCGRMENAREVFDRMTLRDVISWNAIISEYAQHGHIEKALEIFKQMQSTGVKPNSSTLASILPVCAKMGDLDQGMEIHQKIMENRTLSDVVVLTALIDMYAKCGSILKAYELFEKIPQRNVVSWNAMIVGYAQNGFVEKSLETFEQMRLVGVKSDLSTFASILPACAKMGALQQGMDIHQIVIKSGFLSDAVVVTALIDMYVKCGHIQKAHKLFDYMPQRDMVSWTAIISGYTHAGLVDKALEIFKQMQFTGVKPDTPTFASILPACAKLGALAQGMEIHQRVIESGFVSDVVVTALMDMYAKCGIIQKAVKLFKKMHHPGVVSWNAIIAGHAMHGYSKDAFELFELMKHSGTNPDHVSFLCVLFASSHVGSVDDGSKYFNHMTNSYGIMPKMEHYVCMVDILGRAGYLEETLNFIIKMPIKPGMVVWECLLAACRSHKNIGLGEFVSRLILEIDPKTAAPYVLLSNIYAEADRWDEVQKVRNLMKHRGIQKIPGCSWIELHKMVHGFCSGDKSHPQTQEIYAMLEKLSWEMKAAGYIPDTKPVLSDVEEEEKGLLICHHSEKLAIAFGLLNTSPGTTIRVVKNLRVCVDCHTATKFISKVAAREIIVRDANRFHHFKHGQCSCGDYW
ncbi:pentatricopeptide repeat-containing protein At4g30700 [Cryptomeria japonica]|uniref:pentatricopeptide repeat-containing protein At4g30700 n=1 Tax=Cryptomeria japonica TaxID=3369 RepID=UPI0025AD31F7|nr:pentatricopeptide repeat-containing protein At4g30700 [Cryptomeria japonica]